jgi:hypothetical protein
MNDLWRLYLRDYRFRRTDPSFRGSWFDAEWSGMGTPDLDELVDKGILETALIGNGYREYRFTDESHKLFEGDIALEVLGGRFED